LPVLFEELKLKEIAVGAGTFLVNDLASAESGLRLRTVVEEARDAGMLSPDQSVLWLERLEKASAAGKFFAAITAFTVVGQKS
jgi:hypothetical protein